MIGLVLALAAAYLLEYLDDTLKSPDDVRKATELTTLGAVPVMKGVDADATLPMQVEGQSAAAEAYRVLRTNLQFVGVGKPLRTLMITSPEPSEGKSITAGNLAAALAHAGKQVVLVDADLHRPRQHRLFGLPNNLGLTTALLDGDAGLANLLQATAIPGLSVLTTGPLPPNPAELLGSARMHELIDALAARCDMLIFDTPPVMALADAAVLGSQVDGVLMVFSAGADAARDGAPRRGRAAAGQRPRGRRPAQPRPGQRQRLLLLLLPLRLPLQLQLPHRRRRPWRQWRPAVRQKGTENIEARPCWIAGRFVSP